MQSMETRIFLFFFGFIRSRFEFFLTHTFCKQIARHWLILLSDSVIALAENNIDVALYVNRHCPGNNVYFCRTPAFHNTTSYCNKDWAYHTNAEHPGIPRTAHFNSTMQRQTNVPAASR
jgi:hypothetical protein